MWWSRSSPSYWVSTLRQLIPAIQKKTDRAEKIFRAPITPGW
jgi:hypothetical protein